MKTKSTRRLQQQRHKILATAAHFIAENGYHGMTMRALAKATGKSLATAYNYFSSKEEILFALQKEAFETLIGAAENALADVRPPNSRLYVFILNHLSYFALHADVMRVLIHEADSLPPARRRSIRKLKKAYFEIGQEVIAQVLVDGCGQAEATGRPPRDPDSEPLDKAELERITYSMFGMLNWIYTWYDPKRHGEVAELARTMRHLILCGAVTSCPAVTAPGELERRLTKLETLPLISGGAEEPAAAGKAS